MYFKLKYLCIISYLCISLPCIMQADLVLYHIIQFHNFENYLRLSSAKPSQSRSTYSVTFFPPNKTKRKKKLSKVCNIVETTVISLKNTFLNLKYLTKCLILNFEFFKTVIVISIYTQEPKHCDHPCIL